MKFKSLFVDNSDGNQFLQISAKEQQYDFDKNLATLKITGARELYQYHSPASMLKEENDNPISFKVPIPRGKYFIDLITKPGADEPVPITYTLTNGDN